MRAGGITVEPGSAAQEGYKMKYFLARVGLTIVGFIIAVFGFA